MVDLTVRCRHCGKGHVESVPDDAVISVEILSHYRSGGYCCRPSYDAYLDGQPINNMRTDRPGIPVGRVGAWVLENDKKRGKE